MEGTCGGLPINPVNPVLDSGGHRFSGNMKELGGVRDCHFQVRVLAGMMVARSTSLRKKGGSVQNGGAQKLPAAAEQAAGLEVQKVCRHNHSGLPTTGKCNFT